MSLEKIRKSSTEIELEGRINQLFTMVDNLSTSIRYALPSANIPDFRGGNIGYYGSGITQFHQPLNGQQIMDGRGPRFVSKYNLARSDEERQALLDSLPKYDGRKHDWQKLFEEYRTHLSPSGKDSYQSRSLAQEFEVFYKSLVTEGRFVQFDGTLEDIVNQIPYTLKADDTIDLPLETFYRQITADAKQSMRNLDLVLFQVPEIMGYVVVGFDYAHTSQGLRLRFEVKAIVRWSVHELCWAIVSRDSIDGDAHNAVFQRWHDEMGFPVYEAVSDNDMVVLGENVQQRAVNEWLLMPGNEEGEESELVVLNPEKIEQRTITLDGVLRLEIRPPRPSSYSYSSDWSFNCYFLDTPEDIAARAHFVLFWEKGHGSILEKLTPFFYVNDDRGSDCGRIQNVFRHHDRQRKRVKVLLEHLIQAPTETLTIVDKPRESYDRDDD